MAGALDQAATSIKELVGHPLQRDAAVRTAMAVDVDLPALAHREQTLAPDLETLAAGVFQLVQTAQGNGVTHGFHRSAGPGCSAGCRGCRWPAARRARPGNSPPDAAARQIGRASCRER